MIQKVSTPVTVWSVFDHKSRSAKPAVLVWEQKRYQITKVGLHHTTRLGRTLFHIFSVATKSLFFRLVLNTETLSWTLEEISDGETN